MKQSFLTLAILFIINIAYGQVETKFYPNKNAWEQVKHISNHPKSNKIKTFPSFDAQQLIKEDKQTEGLDIPFRFGKGFDTQIILKDGEWTKTDDGRLWSMEFRSKGAYSINFVFNNFHLPDGAELYITNATGTMLYGPVTSKENTKNGFFLTDLIKGDDVTIFLFEPQKQKGQSTLRIEKVVHAYKNVFPNAVNGNLGGSDTCNIDIACYPAWDESSDAVALVLLSSGTELCSGALVMTTHQNFRPYFLTAFHCIDEDAPIGELSSTEISNAENWMFKFQYKMTSCGGSTATTGITYNGDTFRAAYYDTDCALVEMDGQPRGDNRFSWLGWDRSGNTPTSGTFIHHPSGDVMKISFDYDNLSTNSSTLYWNNGGISPANSHWQTTIDDGGIEGGSSGSPLLDQNRRVVGQLHGGSIGCAPQTDYFGRFNQSWTGGGTDATRLSNWLDPCGLGATTVNTARSPYVSRGSAVCVSGTSFSVPNLPNGTELFWDQSSNISRSSAQGSNPCTFYPLNSGSGWIKATLVTSSCDRFSLPIKYVDVVRPTGTWGQDGQTHDLSTVNFVDYQSWVYVTVTCPGSSYFNWQLTGGTGINWSQINYANTSYLNLYLNTSTSYGDLRLTINTAGCGTIQPTYHFVPSYSYAFTMTPNPANDVVTVERVEKSNKNKAKGLLLKPSVEKYKEHPDKPFDKPLEDYTVTLYNERNGLLKTIDTKDESCTFDLSKYPPGIYFLHIENDYVLYKEKLIIKR
ncbi:trypsin-like peptidase domain-containing protein [Prolixibacter sp. SD074]|uniref:trypsin-like peptidase domain-containing protein n=1 Tax=Prolixibacter sp. SD074 TaxID=2652391 RepID=UPI0012825478|nr:trypsin-like peptidase domain-containing protein [Prolixibacter sp. SD074]GET29825.1 hypothetical protein SD074_20270 [Prolixibacter sp. SD074]